jgi:predicted nucleotidyltransferase
MATAPAQLDTRVSEEKILAAVERIVEAANPVRIIAFGSRARGDFRQNSDLDLAVIVDHLTAGAKPPVTRGTLGGIIMPIDLLVFDRERHERMLPWPGSVHYDIGREGVVLYDRKSENGTDSGAVRRLVGR